ncbi:hypothetical protein MmiHf6_07300 [Methanimicrococcus hongohii]|uniref:Uncharacterized protein n=1 Tax=Methanimicrococcus hongohii TaxID=3028295 RepID=A0AA97A1L7_9EURY|nr:hypothetical protein [Methanimicrococcus sp. Hf6]WNY23423.1 hypothetical protein MmiHf6_07300 [Methanimicrococcus sp. Hf6]
MAGFLSPQWIVDNIGIIFVICIIVAAYFILKKRPLEKPVNQMIQNFGRESFLNKDMAEIEKYLEENVDFSDVDYTADALAKEIYLKVNQIDPKKYEKEQKMKS